MDRLSYTVRKSDSPVRGCTAKKEIAPGVAEIAAVRQPKQRPVLKKRPLRSVGPFKPLRYSARGWSHDKKQERDEHAANGRFWASKRDCKVFRQSVGPLTYFSPVVSETPNAISPARKESPAFLAGEP
jgi:hypothetical protein